MRKQLETKTAFILKFASLGKSIAKRSKLSRPRSFSIGPAHNLEMSPTLSPVLASVMANSIFLEMQQHFFLPAMELQTYD